MKNANPYLNFPGNAREAFEFYHSVFGGEIWGPMRFRDMESSGEMCDRDGSPMSEEDLDLVAHVAIPIGDSILMASDVPPAMGPVTNGNNFHVTVEPESADEARTTFEKLSAGGDVRMPLMETEWAELYAMFVDRFGIPWMVNYTGSKG